MKILKEIKKIISNACVYFTAAEFFILIIASAYSGSAPEKGGAVGQFLSLGAAALIFAACAMFSVLNLVFRLELSTPVKVFLHFAGSLLAFSLVFVFIPKAYTDFGAMFVRLGIFAIIYAVVAAVVFLVRSARSKKRSDELEYESQFGDFMSERRK